MVEAVEPSGGTKGEIYFCLHIFYLPITIQIFNLRDAVTTNRGGPPDRVQKIKDALGSVKELFKFKPPSPPSTAQTLGSFGHLRLSQASFIPENNVTRRRSTSAPSSPRRASLELPPFYNTPNEFTSVVIPEPFRTLPARPERPPRPHASELLMVPGMDAEELVQPMSLNYHPRPRLTRFTSVHPVPPHPPIQTSSADPLPNPSSTHAPLRTLDERQLEAVMDTMCCHLKIVNPSDGRAAAQINTHTGGRSYEASLSTWYKCVNPSHVRDNLKWCQQPVEVPLSVNVNLNPLFADRENWQRQCIRSMAQELGHHLV